MEVILLISHSHLYRPYCSHLHPSSLSFSSTTLLSSQNTKLSHPSLSLHVMFMSWHRVQHTPSTAYTEYSIDRVQHTPNTAYTQDCLSSLHFHDFELTPECSFSFRHASLQDPLPSASSPWELKGKVTLSHSHGCELTNWWKESQHPAWRPSTASQYSSKLARLRPPNSLDHGIQVYLQTCSITASKCFYTLAWSQPPSASPNSLDHSLQVYLYTRPITASKFPWSWPPSASPNSLDHGLGVYLSLLDRHFQAHFALLSSIACSQSRYTACRWVAI